MQTLQIDAPRGNPQIGPRKEGVVDRFDVVSAPLPQHVLTVRTTNQQLTPQTSQSTLKPFCFASAVSNHVTGHNERRDIWQPLGRSP